MSKQQNGEGFVHWTTAAELADPANDLSRANNYAAKHLSLLEAAEGAEGTASQALATANAYAGQIAQANTTAGSAVAIATDAKGTAEAIEGPISTRLGYLETREGLAPGDVYDAETASVLTQDGSLSQAALNAQTADLVGSEYVLKSPAGGTGLSENVILAPGGESAIASDVGTSVILNPGSAAYNNVIGGDGANVGTTTPNTTQAGTNANVSTVGGYDNSAGALSSKIISDHSKVEIATTGLGHNAIYGGASHTIKGTAGFSAIMGGTKNTIAGNSTLATGNENTADGSSQFVAGQQNYLGPDARGSTAVGGNHNVTGVYSNARGIMHDVPASYSEASGYRAKTTTAYEQAHADGGFGAPGRNELGSSQRSEFIIRRTSSDAVNRTLGAAGGSTGPVLQPSTAWGFEGIVIGQDEVTGDTAAWTVRGAIRRGATGSSIMVGAPQITQMGADAGAATWSLGVVGSSAGHLNFYVNGQVGKNIRWVGTLRVTQVRMPSAV